MVDAILKMLAIGPCTVEDLCKATLIEREQILDILESIAIPTGDYHKDSELWRLR